MVAAVMNIEAAQGSGEHVLLPALVTSLAELLACGHAEMSGHHEAAKAATARTASEGIAAGCLAPWQVQRVKTLIGERLDQTIHVKDLAEVAQRSVAYFCRAFKRTFGETPHAYIVGCRLDRARRLMLTTDMALSAIALSCGFTDQAHLCKLFRQSEGQSPSVWRRQRRENPIELSEPDTALARREGGASALSRAAASMGQAAALQ